jgi:uncharacterized Tic20 family protein
MMSSPKHRRHQLERQPNEAVQFAIMIIVVSLVCLIAVLLS